MPTVKKSHFLKILFTAIVLILLFLFWVFAGDLTQTKVKVLSYLPVPIASVGNEPILISSFLRVKSELPQKYTDKEILFALETNFQNKQLAKTLNVQPLYGTSQKPNEVIKELLGYKTALEFYYNSNIELNSRVYSLAAQIKNKLEAGQSFEILSSQYNQDDFSKTFGGSVGTIKPEDLLPEVLSQLKDYKNGQVLIVPSRLGVHIVKVVSSNPGSYSLEQIFLKTEGFEKWLSAQTSKIKIKTIIRI